MKKIIYLSVCSLVLFSCSTTLNQASNDITIKEKIIKSITVKSKKDGYIIAKTGEIKQQFNFDTTLKSQDTFESEVEYLDGTKTNQVIWESSEKNDIAVENGVITGKKYSNVDIIVYNKSKSKKVIFKANFVNNLVIKEKELCSDAEIINKYDYLYDIPKNEDVIEKDLGTIFNKTDDIKEKPTFNRTIKKTEIYNSFIVKNYKSIDERATFNGKVFDTSGFTIDDVKIEARSLDFCTEWVGIHQYTQSGAYVLRNTPIGVPIEITCPYAEIAQQRKINMFN
ncbi:MAG: hypothetical protein AABZ74_15220 [Cyanobacteriota bacterium]